MFQSLRRRIRNRIWIVAILAGGLTLYSYTDDYFEISRNLDIFTTLFRELNMYYVDETHPGDLMKRGIDAMLESLDPYTNYIPESEIEDYRFMTTGQYGGIGALIGQKDDQVVITDPYEGYPAQKADLRAGDVIVEIDGRSTEGKRYDEISKILKGQPKTTVHIKVQRPGQEGVIAKDILREEIKINNVPYSGKIGDGLGYIRLTGFTDNAGREVEDALLKLTADNALKGLILDLRGNPGGLLNEAVNIVNIFVEKGTDVVSTKGKVQEWDKQYKALNNPVDTKLPVIVLVNRGSASAAEIVSGSLQDLDRAVIIGERTFGKGLVQTTRPLSYNAQLKVTTAKYYVPSGRCIQALDYSHRNEDGSVGRVPDSLISEFKTKSGRIVYDGGGIIPDCLTERHSLSPIAQILLSKYLIFDYATRYRQVHPTIDAARRFRITDADYDQFVAWLSDKEYDYMTQSEQSLQNLKKHAEKEKYFDSFSAEYEALRGKMMHDKNQDLVKYKEEIRELLQVEIASRYYYQDGRIESSFATDPDIKQATVALLQPAVFDSLFHRPAVKNTVDNGGEDEDEE